LISAASVVVGIAATAAAAAAATAAAATAAAATAAAATVAFATFCGGPTPCVAAGPKCRVGRLQ